MSETMEAADPPVPDVAAPPVDAAPPETQDAPAPADDGQTVAEDPPPAPKPKASDRRWAQAGARIAALEQQANDAQRRAEAAEALLRAKDGMSEPPKTVPAIDRNAIRAEIEYETSLTGLIDRGTKEYGSESFNQLSGVLAHLGAKDNPAFMQASTFAQSTTDTMAKPESTTDLATLFWMEV